MTNVTAIIQARTGSTRLPGKVMYPLNGQPALEHVVTRTAHADSVDTVVVATSTEPPDDVIEHYSPTFGANIIRGSESDVLSRFGCAIREHNSDIIVRITGDNPLILPEFINFCVDQIQTKDIDYISEGPQRTFPLGTTCEAFTIDSFTKVLNASSTPEQREHVTAYYKQHSEEFNTENIKSGQIFSQNWLQNRTGIRLTLDEPADYKLFKRLYQEIPYQTLLDIQNVIKYIDENDLSKINSHVEQKLI